MDMMPQYPLSLRCRPGDVLSDLWFVNIVGDGSLGHLMHVAFL